MDAIDSIVQLIPQSLLDKSGSVFYSGRSAFTMPSPLYILGENPGGSPIVQADQTVRWHTAKVLNGPPEWSAYRDEQWKGKQPGTCGMQPRILHFLRQVDFEPRSVPASNIVFERSARGHDINDRFNELARLCWPFHQRVIDQLQVRLVLCLGTRSGSWVCKRLNAKTHIGQFVESNNRRWTSNAFVNSNGIAVAVVTHPSIADWTKPATDPSPLVLRILESVR